jgi:hypothetical protein
MSQLQEQVQKKLLANFRAGVCNRCLEFSHMELKCTMVDKHSKEYFVDSDFTCPIGEF